MSAATVAGSIATLRRPCAVFGSDQTSSLRITGTERLDRRTWQEWSVGKAHLVSRLQALLQTRRLHLPDTAEARQLVQELLDYEIRVQPTTGTLQAGAFGMRHDDLATALGLAVLQPYHATQLIPSPF